jgi:hypothetical protein
LWFAPHEKRLAVKVILRAVRRGNRTVDLEECYGMNCAGGGRRTKPPCAFAIPA